MSRQIRLILGLLCLASAVGWSYLVFQMESISLLGSNPDDNAVRCTLYAIPYLVLFYDLLTCVWPGKALCGLGLIINLPILGLAAGWITQPNGITFGLPVLVVMGFWYAYAVCVLRQPASGAPMTKANA